MGIGAALCKSLTEAGMIVCGMSKRKDKMDVSEDDEKLVDENILPYNLLARHFGPCLINVSLSQPLLKLV